VGLNEPAALSKAPRMIVGTSRRIDSDTDWCGDVSPHRGALKIGRQHGFSIQPLRVPAAAK